MHALTLYYQYNRRTMAALAVFVALCAFVYGALLLGAVAHAAHRTEAESQIRKLSSAVSSMESRYLDQTETLSPQGAAALGFVAPKEVSTVFISSQTLTLAR